MSPRFFSYFTLQETLPALVLFICLVVAWFAPRLGNAILSSFERIGTRCAERRGVAFLVIGFLPLVARLCLLPLIPVPVPGVQDEFSYLLNADTFAHSRLTNPPHAMRVFFDTIHVNQLPTYMSKYPPAQGATLALGQVLGHPWIGVLLSVSAMCVAILWMLQGWLPSRWAFLGAVLVTLRLAIFSYWMNSYWGGAVAAIGGALVVGALPRILRWGRTRDALLLGIGAAILANSRPYEGFFLCLSVGAFFVARQVSRKGLPWRLLLPRVVFPLFAVLLLTGIFMGYYNWRGTGHPLLTPYEVNERTYIRVPLFIWQKPRPPQHYSNPQLEYEYNNWEQSFWERNRLDGIRHLMGHVAWVVIKFVYFFMWPELCVPLLAVPWLLRDRRVRFLVIQFSICFVAMLAVVWSQPHYAAPLTAILFALIVQSLRHLRLWQYRGRPVGIGLSRVVIVFAFAMSFVYIADAINNPYRDSFVASAGVWGNPGNHDRAQILRELEAMPGQQLVIVRYSTGSPASGEWVNNRADIDGAKVVWAREIPGVDIKPLLDYFRGREVWLVEPGFSPPRLTRYAEIQSQK